MASVFTVWLLGVASGILGMYMTLHSQKKSRWKVWCWIIFSALAFSGLELSFYQRLEQDEKDDRMEMLQESLRSSNGRLREAVDRLGKKFPAPVSLSEKFLKWIDVNFPEHATNVRQSIQKGNLTFNIDATTSQAESLKQMASEDSGQGMKVVYTKDSYIGPIGGMQPLSVTFKTGVFK